MKTENTKPVKGKVTKVKEKKSAKEKKTEKKVKEVKQRIIKKVKVSRRQRALNEKKAKLVVKGRQTKWAPVWVVIKKYGTGKRVHPSATTRYKRSWRRTKLKITPRKIRKWHMG